MRTEKYNNRYWLKKKFTGDNLSAVEIAALCNVSERTIRRKLNEWGIKKTNPTLRCKNLHCRVDVSFYENLKQFCRYKNIRISTVMRTAMLEFMIRNKFNPYK